MSLSHLALRLAAVEALAPRAQFGAAAPVWPTLARGRVVDSQLSPEALSEQDALTPMIAVFSEESKTDVHGSSQDATIDGHESVTLALEIMVPALTGEGEAAIVATDPLAEAYLNLIATQIGWAFEDARMTGALRHVLIAIGEVESRPWRDADTDVALSARRLELTCAVRRTGPRPPLDATGLARLPSPLREVVLGLPEGSVGASTGAVIAALINDPAVFGPLEDIRLAANLARLEGDAPAAAADAAATPPTGDLAGSIDLPQP